MKMCVVFWREKTGPWGVLALWLPFYVYFGLLNGRFFFYPLWSILSGKYWQWFDEIFWKPFPKECAGFYLDQPTVGKFFFCYSVLTFFALIFAVVIRLMTDMRKKPNKRVYCFFYILAFLWCISFMLWPVTLLAHYIIAMGTTITRMNGIIYLSVSILVWPVSGWFLLRVKKDP